MPECVAHGENIEAISELLARLSHPITGLMPIRVEVRLDAFLDTHWRKGACWLRPIYPDPKPTIPELIAKWHANPSAETQRELWQAITDAAFRTGGWQFDHGPLRYFAKCRTGSDYPISVITI